MTNPSHSFLVPIRDLETHEILPGVVVEDMGHKMGLNGIDNAKLAFDNVKIPRENMLDRFAQIDGQGNYHTEVQGNARSRFLKTADQLLSGRICIASMSQGSSKGLLAIATEYSCSRLSTNPTTGESSTPIMAFNLQQRSLIPMLAKTIAIETALQEVKQNWKLNRQGQPKNSHHSLIAQCCAIKAYSGWHANRVANEARERCGGQGFLSANRFGLAVTGTHSSITAEGDNSVLMMKTVSELGQDLKKNKRYQEDTGRVFLFAEVFSRPILGYLLRKTLSASSPLSQFNLEKDSNMKTLAQYTQILSFRYNQLMVKLGEAQKLTGEDKDFIKMVEKDEETAYKKRIGYHKTVTDNQQLIQRTALAWTELFVASQMMKRISAFASNPEIIEDYKDETIQLLEKLCELYMIDCVKNDAGFFTKFFHGNDFVDNVNKRMDILCDRISPDVLGIIDSFGFTKEMNSAPIARDWVKFNKVDNQGEVKNVEY